MLSGEKNDVESVFSDANTISARHENAVTTAIKLGIVRGREKDGSSLIAPEEKISVAEAKTIISRIQDKSASTDAFFSENESSRPLFRGEGAALVLTLLKDK